MLPKLLESNNVLIPDMVLVPVAAIQEVGGFEPHLVCGEDGNLWRRIVEDGVQPISLQLPVAIYDYRLDSQSKLASTKPDVAEFNDKAFHLGPEIHGPMGQKLDDQAVARYVKFAEAATDAERIEALAPGTHLRSIR